MIVEITKGWDGEKAVDLGQCPTASAAHFLVSEWAEKHDRKNLRSCWTVTKRDDDKGSRIIMDYGSHTLFGRAINV